MRLNVRSRSCWGRAVGYVAGTADGRRRDEQIRTAADSFAHDPHVRDKANKVADRCQRHSGGRGGREQGQGRRRDRQGSGARRTATTRHRSSRSSASAPTPRPSS